MKQQIVILLWVLYGCSIIGLETIIGTIPPKDGAVYHLLSQIPFYLLVLLPVLYRYLLYQYCGCCEKPLSTASNDGVGASTTQTETTLTQPLIENTEIMETQKHPATSSPPSRLRYAFLDNIKVFLTACVVSHHIANVFGSSGPNPATVIIVDPDYNQNIPVFSFLLKCINNLNQGYFMALFFFISAFFVPSSYVKGRERFLHSKRKRILLPALVVSLVLYPIGDLFSVKYTYGVWCYLFFDYGPAWFLYWLLILNWVYMSIIESEDTSSATSSDENNVDNGTEVERTVNGEQKMPFPSTWTRLFYGATLCGVVLEFFIQTFPISIFAGNRNTNGSWTAHFFMFYAGILAKKHGWLEKDLAEQLDIPLYVFFPMVVIEAVTVVFVRNPISLGLYCVDMSLAVLIIFQRWFNYETKLSKFLARSAYCVFLIHWSFLAATVYVYVYIYNIMFGSGEGTEVGRIVGGFIFANVAIHGIVWPLSYGLTRLPVLRDII